MEACTKTLFLSVLLVLAMQVPATAQELQLESVSTDVYETVVRYQIKVWDLAANTYCVSVDGRNAAKDFLERFNPLPVRGVSECIKRTKQKVLMQVVDRKYGKPAVIFDVGAIHWLTKDEAEVEGGYLCGSSCMAGGKYHVIREGKHWAVTGYKVEIQS